MIRIQKDSYENPKLQPVPVNVSKRRSKGKAKQMTPVHCVDRSEIFVEYQRYVLRVTTFRSKTREDFF